MFTCLIWVFMCVCVCVCFHFCDGSPKEKRKKLRSRYYMHMLIRLLRVLLDVCVYMCECMRACVCACLRVCVCARARVHVETTQNVVILVVSTFSLSRTHPLCLHAHVRADTTCSNTNFLYILPYSLSLHARVRDNTTCCDTCCLTLSLSQMHLLSLHAHLHDSTKCWGNLCLYILWYSENVGCRTCMHIDTTSACARERMYYILVQYQRM